MSESDPVVLIWHQRTTHLSLLILLLFILSWMCFIAVHCALLLILQLDQWPNKVESKTAMLFVPPVSCLSVSKASPTPPLGYMSQPVCKLPHFSSNLHYLDYKWTTLYLSLSCIFLHSPTCSSTSVLFAAKLVSLGCCLYPACLNPSICLSL